MKSCDLETVWAIVSPKVKELVKSYLEGGIEDHDSE
jgi:hypothetical protein